MRRLNASQVLQHAWSADAFTASDLIAITGLTRSTILGVCDDLIDRGWLVALPDARSTGDYRKGRPARRYSLRRKAGYVIGIDAGQHHLSVVVADLGGDVVGQARRDVDPLTLSRAARRLAVSDLIDNVLLQAGLDDAAVLAVSVGVPAPADTNGRSPVEAESDFWIRVNPDYPELLTRRGWVVLVENDANLAAVAEAAALAKKPGPIRDNLSFITLLAGERFGAGIVVDGSLMRGARGAAGEMRMLDLVEGVGSADGIGAVLRDAAQAAFDASDLPARSPLARLKREQLDAPAVLAAADAGDPVALTMVETLAERFARVCAVLSGVLDVDRIVVAGAVAPSIGLLLERATPWLRKLTHLSAPEVVASELGAAVVTVGAVERGLSYVLEHALELELEPDEASALQG